MKMMTTKTLLTALAACTLGVAGTSADAGTLINDYSVGNASNIGVTASSEINSFNQALYTLTTNLSNAEFAPGVLDNPADGQHGSSTRQSWRGNETADAAVAEEWIQWDLGASYQLDSIRVWNYNDSSRFDDGIHTVDIYLSNAAVPGDPEIAGVGNGDNWTHWAVDAILTSAPGTAGYTGFDLETVVGSALPAGEFRFVRFEVDSTHRMEGQTLSGSDSNNASLSQIEFFAVPEPGSLALLGLGGVLVASRRRRG